MDTDDVARLVTELRLSNKPSDEQILILEEEMLRIGEQNIGYCLVAKVFSTKAIN